MLKKFKNFILLNKDEWDIPRILGGLDGDGDVGAAEQAEDNILLFSKFKLSALNAIT